MMSLDAKILHMNQRVDFSSGEISNFVTIELSNGERINVLATDEDAQKIVAEVQRTKQLFKEESAVEVPVAAPAAPVFAPIPQDEGIYVFGEDPRVVERPAPPPSRAVPRAPHVAADEAGNPIGMRPREIPEEPALDEDGVPSL